MYKPLYSTAMIIMAYIFSAMLCYSFVYDVVEQQASQYFDKNLNQVNDLIKEKLVSHSNDQWHEFAEDLSLQLNLSVTIEEQSYYNFTEKQLDKLSSSYGQEGVIDDELGFIYFPVTSSSALVVGPYYSVLASYATELFTWFFALFITLSSFAILYSRQKKELRRLNKVLTDSQEETSKRITVNSLQSKAEQLCQSNKQKSSSLDQLLLTQKDLLHGVAHEFRSPLARMEFALGLLDEADSQQRVELKAQIEHSIVELNDLVKQVLRYSRLQYGSTGIELSRILTTELLERAIEKVAPFYPDIDFILEDKSHCLLSCDSKLMEMAISNILRNAGRFAYSKCLVTVKNQQKGIIISIQDDGLGVPPGKRESIFEPFTRLDPSRSRDSGGYGLGLAIVKSIIDKHAGMINIEDAPVRGANFIIKIPNS